MKTQNPLRLLAAVSAAALVAACGGNDDPVVAAPAPLVSGSAVPVSATTSAGGAFDFVSSQVTPGGNNGEPIELGNAMLATSDTAEPTPV
ncbi:MAG: hypothetical protein ACKVOO_04460 [Burkholderiaceae bacterium]